MKLKGMCALVAAMSFGSVRAVDYTADVTISDAADLPEDHVFNVSNDVTVTVGVAIDGDFAVTKQGAGTLDLRATSGFTGGLLFEEGIVMLNAHQPLGTNTVTFAGDAIHYLQFNVANDTFPNAIVFQDAGQPIEGDANLRRGQIGFMADTTLDAPITGPASGKVYIGVPLNGTSTVTYRKTLDFSSAALYIRTWGTHIFDAPLLAKGLSFSTAYSGKGKLYFNVPGSNLGGGSSVDTYCPYFYNGADYAISNFYMRCCYYFAAKDGNCYDLCGHTASIKSVVYAPFKNFLEVKDSVAASLTYMAFENSSEDPATLVFSGNGPRGNGDKGLTCLQHIINGNTSLLLDDAPTTELVLSNRLHQMTGDIMVSNGVLTVSESSSMAKARSLLVGPNGTFRCDSAANLSLGSVKRLSVFGSCTVSEGVSMPFASEALDITFGPEAHLVLPAGTTLAVRSVTLVDAEGKATPLDCDYYDHETLPQLEGGRIFVKPTTETAATWTGGADADVSIGTAANWDTDPALPDLRFQTLLATFASAGTQALVDREFALRGLAFVPAAETDGFALVADTPAREIAVGEGGLAVAASEDGKPRTYAVGPRVVFTKAADRSLDIPADVTLDLQGGLAEPGETVVRKTGAGKLRLGGGTDLPGSLEVTAGDIELAGTNRVEKNLTVRTANVLFAGEIGMRGDPSAKRMDQWTTQPIENGISINATANADKQATATICFSNAVVNKRMSVFGAGADAGAGWFRFAAGTTNDFNCDVFLKAPLGYVSAGADAVIRFNGGLGGSGETRFRGESAERRATYVMTKPVYAGGGGGWRVYDNATVVLACPSNFAGAAAGISTYANGSRIEMTVDDAYISPKNFGINYEGCVVDIHGTKQFISLLNDGVGGKGGNPKSTVTGEYGSVFGVEDGRSAQDFAGGVSLVAMGASGKEFCVTNKALTSCGDVAAISSKLTFSPSSSWLNGTNVTVSGTGVLRIGQNATFDRKHAIVHLADTGVFEIPEGVTQTVRELWHEGVQMPDGLYGSAESAATDKSLADHFAGKGLLRVRGGGMILLVR